MLPIRRFGFLSMALALSFLTPWMTAPDAAAASDPPAPGADGAAPPLVFTGAECDAAPPGWYLLNMKDPVFKHEVLNAINLPRGQGWFPIAALRNDETLTAIRFVPSDKPAL